MRNGRLNSYITWKSSTSPTLRDLSLSSNTLNQTKQCLKYAATNIALQVQITSSFIVNPMGGDICDDCSYTTVVFITNLTF